MGLLAACDANLELGVAPADVEPQRNEGEALRGLEAKQLTDLIAVEQELARAVRDVVVAVALGVLGDVRADEPGLAALDADVGLGDVDLVRANALDLGAGQHDARLEGLLDGVVVSRAPVDGDRLVGHRSKGLKGGTNGRAWKEPAAVAGSLPSLHH